MYSYLFTEFTSSQKINQIRSNKTNLLDVLTEIYGNKIEKMFNLDGESKGYISVFVNSKQITSVKETTLNPNDEICIVTSISGG